MPGTARLITDGASCLFWVRGDGGEPARYRQCQPQARGPSSPQSRALVTGPGRVLLLAALLLFLLCPPLLSLPLTAGRWLPGRPGHGGGAERQSSPPRTQRAGCLAPGPGGEGVASLLPMLLLRLSVLP